MRRLHAAPIGDQDWVVTLDETSQVDVHHVNGEVSVMLLDVDPQRGYPGAARGPLGAA